MMGFKRWIPNIMLKCLSCDVCQTRSFLNPHKLMHAQNTDKQQWSDWPNRLAAVFVVNNQQQQYRSKQLSGGIVGIGGASSIKFGSPISNITTLDSSVIVTASSYQKQTKQHLFISVSNDACNRSAMMYRTLSSYCKKGGLGQRQRHQSYCTNSSNVFLRNKAYDHNLCVLSYEWPIFLFLISYLPKSSTCLLQNNTKWIMQPIADVKKGMTPAMNKAGN